MRGNVRSISMDTALAPGRSERQSPCPGTPRRAPLVDRQLASTKLTRETLGPRMGAVPKVRRSIGVALMMALVMSIGAQCVIGGEMTTAQMACCVGTDHDCGTAAAAPDCCQSEVAAREQLAAHVQQVVFPPAPLTGAVADLTTPPDTASVHGFEIDRVPLIAASPPKYVLLATFLI